MRASHVAQRTSLVTQQVAEGVEPKHDDVLAVSAAGTNDQLLPVVFIMFQPLHRARELRASSDVLRGGVARVLDSMMYPSRRRMPNALRPRH